MAIRSGTFMMVALMAQWVGGMAWADSEPVTDPGKALYGRFCATCHGPAGKGDGPTASIVTIAPVDLTRLTADAGGTFPKARVIRRIDGRDTLVAHGSPMPIYGAFFDGTARVPVVTEEGELLVNQPVLEIVDFLESVQE